MTASSSLDSTVDFGSLGPVCSLGRAPLLLHFGDGLGIDAIARRELPQAVLTMLDRSTDCRSRCGAAVVNLAHSASFHAHVKSAPSNPGIKHLAGNHPIRSPKLRLNRPEADVPNACLGSFGPLRGNHPAGTPQPFRTAAPCSDFGLLREDQRVVNLNAEVANRALQLRVAEQQLAGSDIAGTLVYQRDLRAA